MSAVLVTWSCSREEDVRARLTPETTVQPATNHGPVSGNERLPFAATLGPAVLTGKDIAVLARTLTVRELAQVEQFQTSRAIGGRRVVAGNNPYPWAAVLTMNRDGIKIPFCSAALVRPQWVLTAAHCLGEMQSGDGLYVGGTHFVNDPGEYRTVVLRVPHPQFNWDSMQNDVALLKLESPVENEPLLLVAETEAIDTPPRGARLLGWGASGGSNTSVEQLQELNVPLVDRSVCSAEYQSTITSQMLCAGQVGATTCDGDSGGPLMVDDDGDWVGIGTASFNEYCIKPGVYTRLSSYASWIESVL